MVSEGGPVDSGLNGDEEEPGSGERLESSIHPSGSWLLTKVEEVSAKMGRRFVATLAKRSGRLSTSLGRVPRGMHKVANQTALVLELIDDFKDGTYREVPWHTVAIASAGLLYTVNPADLVPNFIPIVGVLDDMAVIALATRWIHKDLIAYCKFKGYDVNEYFDTSDT